MEKLSDILLTICGITSPFIFVMATTGNAILFFGTLVLFGCSGILGAYLNYKSFITELETRGRYRHIDDTWRYVRPRTSLCGKKTKME